MIELLEQAIERTAERVGPAVVGLGRGWGLGSGVVIGAGRVLTSAHNLRGDDATVTFDDGRRMRGSVTGVDGDLDLAVIAVDTGERPSVDWKPDETTAKLGGAVVALANPGGRGLRATLGFVSSPERSFRGPRGRRITGAIEHTAPLPRGSSGGPLVDPAGRLLGINALRLEGGLIVALAADAAVRARIDLLARGEAPERRRLGVAVAPPRAARRMRRAVGLPDRDGVLVRAVESGSPAERTGIEPGDLIVRAGGREIDSLDDLYAALDASLATDRLALGVVRGSDERELDVAFEDSAQGSPS
jgi:S1-C subfamily serine protease